MCYFSTNLYAMLCSGCATFIYSSSSYAKLFLVEEYFLNQVAPSSGSDLAVGITSNRHLAHREMPSVLRVAALVPIWKYRWRYFQEKKARDFIFAIFSAFVIS